MSCRRLRRELVEAFRYGELDIGSAPHLEHLESCRACRDEVGFDRALVRQLRLALAERAAWAAPSPDAWPTILARSQAPSGGGPLGWIRERAGLIAARMRLAGGVAAAALAIVVGAGTEVVLVLPGEAAGEVSPSVVGERFEREPLVPRSRAEYVNLLPARVAYVPPSAPSDPEAAFQVGAVATTPGPAAADDSPERGPRLVLRSSATPPSPADGPDDAGAGAGSGSSAREPLPVGEPS